MGNSLSLLTANSINNPIYSSSIQNKASFKNTFLDRLSKLIEAIEIAHWPLFHEFISLIELELRALDDPEEWLFNCHDLSQLNNNSKSINHLVVIILESIEHNKIFFLTYLFSHLSHIDINSLEKNGESALSVASKHNHIEIVELLLSLPLIDINALDHPGRPPLYYALKKIELYPLIEASSLHLLPFHTSYSGSPGGLLCTDLLDLLITYPELDLEPKLIKNNPTLSHIEEWDPLAPSHYYWCAEAHDKILAFRKSQATKSAATFALMVFLSDEYLAIKDKQLNKKQEAGKRFFAIAKKLPMELQMVVSNRFSALSGDLIPFAQSEKAFSHWATILKIDL